MQKLDWESDGLIHPADYQDGKPIPDEEKVSFPALLAALGDPVKRANLKKAFPMPPDHSEVQVHILADGSIQYVPLDYKSALDQCSKKWETFVDWRRKMTERKTP